MSRLRILVLLFCILIPITSAIRCQCSSSAGGIQCYSNWCEVNKFQGKVGACAVVRSGAVQHFACVRVKPDSEDGCKVDKGANGELQARCWCRDEDYCNLDLADRIDEDTSNDEFVEESPEEPQPPPRLAHAHGRGQSLLPPDTEEEAGEFSIEGDYVDTEPIDDRLLAATQQNRLSSQHGDHAPRPLTSTLDDLTTVEEREDERLWRLQEEQKIRELVEQRRREEEQRRRKEDESRREAEKRIELERRVEDERRREAERHRQEETRRRHEETKREEEARRAREEAERKRVAEQVRREQEERAKEDEEEEERLRRLEDEESRRRQSEREEAEILDAAKNAHELRQKEKERIRAEMLRENIRREEERMRLQRKKEEEERQKVKEMEERRVAAVSPPQEQDFFNPFADDRVLKASHVHKTQQPAQNSFAERTSTYNALPASVEQRTRESHVHEVYGHGSHLHVEKQAHQEIEAEKQEAAQREEQLREVQRIREAENQRAAQRIREQQIREAEKQLVAQRIREQQINETEKQRAAQRIREQQIREAELRRQALETQQRTPQHHFDSRQQNELHTQEAQPPKQPYAQQDLRNNAARPQAPSRPRQQSSTLPQLAVVKPEQAYVSQWEGPSQLEITQGRRSQNRDDQPAMHIVKAGKVHRDQDPLRTHTEPRVPERQVPQVRPANRQYRPLDVAPYFRPPTATTEVAIMKVSSYIAEVVPTTTTRSTIRSTTSTTTTTTTSTTTSTTTRRTTTTTRRITTPRATTTTIYKAKEVGIEVDRKVENEEKVKPPAVGSAVNIRKHSVPKTPLDSYQQTRSSSTVFSGVLGIMVLTMVSFIL